MSTFYETVKAAAQSSNTVKLIRNGKLFSDSSPDAYTGTWNATLGHYEFTLDTTTFVDATTYRVEDGSGNIVLKDYVIHPPVLDESALDTNVVLDNADQTIVGELTVKPASGTDTQYRIGDEDSDSIRITAENAAHSASRILEIKATSLNLMAQDGSTAIRVANVAAPVSAGDAVNKTYADAISTLVAALDTRVDALEGGSGTFSSPDVALTATAVNGGIRLNWAMNSAPNESAVHHYELYMSESELAGYSAGVVSSGILSNIAANMALVSLNERRGKSAFIPTLGRWFFIVVAYDHTGTPVMEGSAQVSAYSGNALDSTIPIVGGAENLASAVGVLAAELENVKTNSGKGYGRICVFSDNSAAAAASGSTAAALVEYAETNGGYTVKRRVTVFKNSIYKVFELLYRGKSTVSGSAIQLTCSTATAVDATISNSTYEQRSIQVNLENLDDGVYELYIETKQVAGTVTITNLAGFMIPA